VLLLFFNYLFCFIAKAEIFSSAIKIDLPDKKMVPLKAVLFGENFFFVTSDHKAFTARLTQNPGVPQNSFESSGSVSFDDSPKKFFLKDLKPASISNTSGSRIDRIVIMGLSALIFYTDTDSLTLISFSDQTIDFRTIDKPDSLPMGFKSLCTGVHNIFIHDMQSRRFDQRLNPVKLSSDFDIPFKNNIMSLDMDDKNIFIKNFSNEGVFEIDFQYDEYTAFAGDDAAVMVFSTPRLFSTWKILLIKNPLQSSAESTLQHSAENKNQVITLLFSDLKENPDSLVTAGTVIKNKVYLFRHFASALEIDLKTFRTKSIKKFTGNINFSDISVFQISLVKDKLCLTTSRGVYLISLDQEF
jgi:hypothetical protein